MTGRGRDARSRAREEYESRRHGDACCTGDGACASRSRSEAPAPAQRPGRRVEGARLPRADAIRRPRPASPPSRTSARRTASRVDATVDAAQITAANLAELPRRRVPQHRRATCSAPRRRPRSRQYVQGGGGFVGIGSAAQGEAGSAAFDQLIGARPRADSPTGGDRAGRRGRRPRPPVHARPPARAGTARDDWYQWSTRPTGTVHTVARYRAPDAPAGDGTDVGGTDHPISWCRDISNGRSFYTGMGRTAGELRRGRRSRRTSRAPCSGPPASSAATARRRSTPTTRPSASSTAAP